MNNYRVIGKRVGYNEIYGKNFDKIVEAHDEEHAKRIIANVHPSVIVVSIELDGTPENDDVAAAYEWNDSPIDPQEFNQDGYTFDMLFIALVRGYKGPLWNDKIKFDGSWKRLIKIDHDGGKITISKVGRIYLDDLNSDTPEKKYQRGSLRRDLYNYIVNNDF